MFIMEFGAMLGLYNRLLKRSVSGEQRAFYPVW
jgi:hypothetical protein